MDECVVRIRLPDGGRWGRGLLIGLAAGVGLGTFGWCVLRSNSSLVVVAPHSDVGVASARRRPDGRQRAPLTARVAICVGGWLELSIPRSTTLSENRFGLTLPVCLLMPHTAACSPPPCACATARLCDA